jgi:hypothetical protein
MSSFIRLSTRGGDQQRCGCDDSWGKKLSCADGYDLPVSACQAGKSQRDREICTRHHGSHVHVVNVEIDLPFSSGVLLPSLKVPLSGGYRRATALRRQSQSMPTIVKGRVAEDSNGYDGDNQSV